MAKDRVGVAVRRLGIGGNGAFPPEFPEENNQAEEEREAGENASYRSKEARWGRGTVVGRGVELGGGRRRWRWRWNWEWRRLAIWHSDKDPRKTEKITKDNQGERRAMIASESLP